MRPLPLLKRRPRRLPPPGASKIKTHSRLFAGKTRRPFAITTKKRKKLLILALFFASCSSRCKNLLILSKPFRQAVCFESEAPAMHSRRRPKAGVLNAYAFAVRAIARRQYARPARLCAQLRLRAYAALRSYALGFACAHTLRFFLSVRLHASNAILQRFFRVRIKCNVLIIISV